MGDGAAFTLTKTPFERDSAPISIRLSCSFYEPFQLHQLETDEQYLSLSLRHFAGFPYFYPSKDRCFPLKNLNDGVVDRFIELLAPLTLYHCSKASKSMYYRCLDLRGLEFVHVNYRDSVVELNGFWGMLTGSVKDDRCSKFQVCLGSIWVEPCEYFDAPWRFAFVKRHTLLNLHFKDLAPDLDMGQFCAAFFHPRVEYVYAWFLKVHLTPSVSTSKHTLSMDKFNQFLGFCGAVKIANIGFADQSPRSPEYNAVDFTDVRKSVERLAAVNASLETLFFRYKEHLFQLHIDSKRLKRVVQFEGSWYLTDDCDIDSNQHPVYPIDTVSEKYDNLPYHVKFSKYSDVIKHF